MVLRACAFAAGLIGFFAAHAENLIVNGAFSTLRTETPYGWEIPVEAAVGENVFYESRDDVPSIRCRNAGREPLSLVFRQMPLTLVPKARYRMSVRVRTKGFRGEARALAFNARWQKDVGLSGFPSDSDWTTHARTLEMVESEDVKEYGVALKLGRFTGEIEFADFRLEPDDDAAARGSAPSPEVVRPRFFPWSPRLCDIDAATRRVSFRFEGFLPAGESFADYEACLQTPSGTVSAPLRPGVNDFTLPAGCDAGKLEFRVGRKGAREALVSGRMPFRVRSRPAVDVRAHRRFNNFVTEVLSAECGGTNGVRTFSTTRDAYVFVVVQPEGGVEPSVAIDGKAVPCRGAGRREAFVEVGRGEHRLSARGVRKVEVRQISTVFCYPPCQDSRVAENGSYGPEFFDRYVRPNSTVQNCGRLNGELRAAYRADGGKWFTDVSVFPITSGVQVVSRIAEDKWLRSPDCDGATLDEVYFGRTGSIDNYVDGMRRVMREEGEAQKPLWTWVVGQPRAPGVDREAIALSMNVAGGRGRAICEIYCRTQETEEKARAYLRNFAGGTLRGFRSLYPDALPQCGAILGTFTQVPTLTQWFYPEVDWKYYADMQFNLLATDPDFDGLGVIGVYGLTYSDRDIVRWLFALVRHYCLEGETSMLSARHGFRYRPGIIDNGDFRKSFAGWEVSGPVERKTIRKLGQSAEARHWDDDGTGDAFAALTKRPGEVARISHALRGLVPGRQYALDVVVFDVRDAETGTFRPSRFPVTVGLDPRTAVDAARSWVHVDRRTADEIRIARYRGARVNRHHIVFTALSEEGLLSIDNSGAPDGTEYGVNWISCRPRYD